MITDKILVVATNVKNIDLKKKEITFSLKYPDYLKNSNEDAKELLELLLEQNLNYFSKIAIRGLELRYRKYSGEDLK
jgi:hypothetical protein